MSMTNSFRRYRARASSVRRVCVLACAFACLLGDRALAPPKPGRTICFYVDKGIPGHCFVQLHPVGNAQASAQNLVYGKYPATIRSIFGGPGVILNDSGRAWSQRICYPVTVGQYNAAVIKITGKIAAPPAYHLVSNPPGNCVNWITSVATAATLTLPNKFSWFFGIATPGAFGRALKSIGAGGMFMGGTVEFNPNPSIAPDGGPVASVMPIDWDAEQLAAVSTEDPVLLAELMDLPLDSVHVGPMSTTVAAGFVIQVGNTSPDEALIAVDWGDGSGVEGQLPEFVHSYDAGLYDASLAVVNCGAIHAYQWTVDVTSEGPVDNTVQVTVPTPVCSDEPNEAEDFPPGPVLEPDTEPGLPALPARGLIGLALVLLVGAAIAFGRRRAADASDTR